MIQFEAELYLSSISGALAFYLGQECVFTSLWGHLKTVSVMQMCSFQQIRNI